MDSPSAQEKLNKIRAQHGCGFVLLLDPDALDFEALPEHLEMARQAGVDVLFVGGSLIMHRDFNESVAKIKAHAEDLPVIIFPGNLQQLSPMADAILFLCLISGRNPEHLIGNQVVAAPLIRKMNLEAISCGYMLVESGEMTSAGFISNSLPLPRSKPAIAVAHAMAAEYLGLSSLYLEAGSGAAQSVPEKMISAIRRNVQIPLFVGGGIRSPEDAAAKAAAGADFVVIGNFFEGNGAHDRLAEFADAIHNGAGEKSK